jgi:hypothetical protein
MEKVKKPLKYKYDTRMVVSYSDESYEGVRKWSLRKGISMQDLQRKAMEFYLNHLEMDYIQLQKEIKQYER